MVSLVRKDSFVVVHAEIFDRRDEIQKTFDVLRLEKTDGYWTALEMRMTDARERTRTDLVIEKIEYDVGLTPDDFSRRELERGAAASASAASSPSFARTGARHAALSLCRPLILLGALLLAPRASITRIDNDLTAWFSRDDPVYRSTSGSRTSSAAPAR